MLPTPKSAHIDSALTNISIGYRPTEYIADMIFPSVPVMKQSDYFFIFRKGAWFRNEAQVRGPGAKAARGGYPLTSDTYSCIERAFAHPVPIELVNNADRALRPFETGVRFATNKVLLAKEIIASSLITTYTNWTTYDDVNGDWASDAAANTFIADVESKKETVRKLIGRMPNTLIMDSKTLAQIKQCDDVLERIKYMGTMAQPAMVTANTLAQLFELDRVLIGGAIYSDAEEVVAGTDFNAVDLWEKTATKGSAWLGYVSPNPALDEPSAGYTFNWPGDAGQLDSVQNTDEYRTIRYWWESDIKSWLVECSEYMDMKITSADAGCLFYDTIVQ